MLLDATVDTFTFAGANELPDTTRRQAKTDVVCGDGESIIIGGLTQEEETRVTKKTPLLGDIPILGQFFRHTRRNTRQTTLVIFVTPRVVVDSEVSTESVEGPPGKPAIPVSFQ